MSYSLTREVLLLTFTLAGISLKLADNYGASARGYLSAAVSAVCMGFLIADNSSSSSIVLGIMIGVTLAGKLDQLNLIFGLCATLISAAVLGFSVPNLPLLAIVLVAALLDEVGHEKVKSPGILATFFHFRMVLKAVVASLALLMWIDLFHAVGFFCFDVAYDATNIVWPFFARDVEEG